MVLPEGGALCACPMGREGDFCELGGTGAGRGAGLGKGVELKVLISPALGGQEASPAVALGRWLKLLCLLFLTIPSFVPSDRAGPHHALPPGVQWLLLPGAEWAADLRS